MFAKKQRLTQSVHSCERCIQTTSPVRRTAFVRLQRLSRSAHDSVGEDSPRVSCGNLLGIVEEKLDVQVELACLSGGVAERFDSRFCARSKMKEGYVIIANPSWRCVGPRVRPFNRIEHSFDGCLQLRVTCYPFKQAVEGRRQVRCNDKGLSVMRLNAFHIPSDVVGCTCCQFRSRGVHTRAAFLRLLRMLFLDQRL